METLKRHQCILAASACSVFLLALTLGMTVPASGQARSGKSANIAGVWESKTAQGVSTLLLNADGSGEFNGKELQWTFNQNILSLSFKGGSTYMYETVFAGNNLTVKSADLKQPISFTRAGSPGAAPAKPAASGGLGAITAASRPAGASGPEGSWQVQMPSGTFTLVLEPGGSGRFNNDHVQWKFSQGILTLRWDDGNTFMYNATLTANSLKVTGGNLGAPITFERAGAGASGEMAAAGRPRAQGATARPAGGGLSPGPVGHWETPTQDGVISLVLNPDGSGTFGQGPIQWSYSRDVLTLTGPNGKPVPYNVSIGPDALTLSGEGLDAPISFQRSGGGGASASRGGVSGGGIDAEDEGVEEGDEGLDDSGQAPSGFGGSTAGGIGGGTGSSSRRGAAGGVTGSWRNQQGSTLQLNPDGTAILNGQRFRYSNDGSTITLIGSDGSMPFPYSLSGNTLTVSVQGQTVAYTRTGGAGGQGGRAGGSFGGGGGSNPQEMVGKWCAYSGSSTGQIISGREQCFTLHPDGTYEYYGASDSTNQFGGVSSQSSDGGTWSIEGSTIVANSRSQGRVVYQLEKKNNKNNDPMLCLDGDCFVTYGQKPPWP